jgi:hypothetical protein
VIMNGVSGTASQKFLDGQHGNGVVIMVRL